MKRILLIEDDENLSRGISFAFEKDGFDVICAASIREGQRCSGQNDFDIIILDLNLPDGDGIELCRKIREDSNVPVIILTARDLETDEVEGLMAGADDFITKPFSLSVLRARVDAQLRRAKSKNQIVSIGKFKLDNSARKLYCAGKEILLSATEFRLVNYFMRNAGHVLSKEQILASLWDNQGNYVDDNTLQANISRLRAKIEDNPKNPEIIKTVHGIGYVWVRDAKC